MGFSWQKWCGFCGKIPKESESFIDLRGQEMLMETARRCFAIPLVRNTAFLMCAECETFLKSLERFATVCANTKSLLKQLRKQKSDDKDVISKARTIFLSDHNEVYIKNEDHGEASMDHGEASMDQDDSTTQADAVEKGTGVEEKPKIEEVEEVEILPAIEDDDSESGDQEMGNDDPDPDEDVVDPNDALKQLPTYAFRLIGRGKRPEIMDRRKMGNKRAPRPKTEEGVFKCNDCGKNFWTIETLKLHENKHKAYNDPTKYRPYVCEVCGKSVMTEVALNEHRTVHTDERPFVCKICHKGYKTPQQYNVHLKTHADEKHVCPECGQLFSTRKTYNRHKMVHSEERKHVCVLCGDKFKRAKALKDHLMSHFQMKAYKCPWCEDRFQHGVNLRHHRKKFHPVELAALEAAGPDKMEQVWNENRSLPKYSEILAMADEKAIKDGIKLPEKK